METIMLISAALGMLRQLSDYIQRLRERARQNGELTPEQDKALDDEIKRVTSQAHWKPDQP